MRDEERIVKLIRASVRGTLALGRDFDSCDPAVHTHPNDDLGIGFLWILIFAATTNLCLPVCLGIAAELIQRKVLSRRFTWSNAFLRSLLALPIAVGPVYAIFVAGFVESRRPAHWVEKEVLAYALSAASAYIALRIRKPPQPTQ